MLKPLTDISAVPLSGGCITRHHKALLPFGSFSEKSNIRDDHPGFRKRPGQIKLHDTADSTNEVLSLYQFRKQRIDEKHFLAQMSDGDVLSATNAPPVVATSAVFGAEVFSGTGTGEVPASWSTINDILLYSNGVDQHQLYAGTANYVDSVIVYSETSAAPDVPEAGVDYSIQATDGLTTTVVVLDAFRSNANHAMFICTPVPATQLTFTISKANGNSSTTGTLSYRKSDNTWADTTETDGCLSGTTAMAQTGTMTWARPSDEIPCFMYGRSGYWYRWMAGGQLDAEVEITKITYGHYASNTPVFEDVENVWDGTVYAAVEAMVEGTTTFATYGSTAVNLSELAGGKKIMISSPDPLCGIYVDVGAIPNATGTSITSLKYWSGTAFTTVGTPTDGTSGLSNSGWITFPRKAAQPLQFQSSQYYAYWYELIFDSALAEDVSVGFYTMPYFDIEDFGKGYCSTVWKDRGIYSFTLYGNYIYISADGRPLALNGDDYGILKAGDGRTNKVVAMRKFHNELMVFQAEKGIEGGCVTLFQGYSPTTFGKLIISSSIGTFSNKTVAVVNGVMTSTETEDSIKDLVFFLTRHGVAATDGMTISLISDDIQNYFDPTQTECIRRGYEDKMWLSYDSAFNVIRIGLVSGSSATLPNVFPVFDLTDKSWSFDTPAQELSCLVEAEAGSGNIPVLQIAGGIDDGLVYLSNSGTNDVSTAIDSFFTMELNARGEYIQLLEMLLRAEAVAASAGDITVTFTKNTISAGSKTLSMSPEITNQTIRRHRFDLNIDDQNISIKVQNATASKAMNLLDMGVRTQLYETR